MQSKINQELDTNLLLELQEKINTDVTMRYLNLCHREIGKLSLASFRKFCKMLSTLGCLYAIDLSANDLCDLTPIQHTVLLDSLRKLPYLSRINLAQNNLLQLGKFWLTEYMSLISGKECAAALNLNNTDLALSVLEAKDNYEFKDNYRGIPLLARDKEKKQIQILFFFEEQQPLRLEIFTRALCGITLTELALSNTNLSQVAKTLAAWDILCEGLAGLKQLRTIDLSSNQLNTVQIERRKQLWSQLSLCEILWYCDLRDNSFDYHEAEIIKSYYEENESFIGVSLDEDFYEFNPQGRHFFRTITSLMNYLSQGNFPMADSMLNYIIIMLNKKVEFEPLKVQLLEVDGRITLSSFEHCSSDRQGLFFNQQRLSNYKQLDALYDAPNDSLRILYAKTALRYKKSLAEQNTNISLFCDQFQRTFDSLTCKLNLAAEGAFTKNYGNMKVEGIENLAHLSEHLIHVFSDSVSEKAKEILEGFALFLPAVRLIAFIYELGHMHKVQSDARTFMAFVKTPQRATALGQVLAYNLCFQMQDQLRALDCANKSSVISELARECVKKMIQLMVSDATPANLDLLLLGEKLCSRYMISCPSKAKELSQQTLDSFVEQETKKRTP